MAATAKIRVDYIIINSTTNYYFSNLIKLAISLKFLKHDLLIISSISIINDA